MREVGDFLVTFKPHSRVRLLAAQCSLKSGDTMETARPCRETAVDFVRTRDASIPRFRKLSLSSKAPRLT